MIGSSMTNALLADALLLRDHQDPAPGPIAAPASDDVPSKVDASERTDKFDDIQAMRAGLCMGRLHSSEKCLTWFTDVCKTHNAGDGSCHKFWDYLQTTCIQHRNEPEYQLECKAAIELGLEVDFGAPAPAAMAAPGAAPAAAPPGAPAAVPTAAATAAPPAVTFVPGPAPAGEPVLPEPRKYTKIDHPMPDQGYDEGSWERVQYDGESNHNKDWQDEHDEENTKELKKLCATNSDNEWCKRNYPTPKPPSPPKQWYEKLMR